MSNIVPAAGIATTAAFAGGGLLTQTVVVRQWQSMDPATFLTHFRTYGPATGATLFPIEVASVLLLGRTTYSTIKRRGPRGSVWACATGCMVGTVLLLPIHFARANRALLDPDFPLQEVPRELTAWYAWNWLRTGLALLASGLACTALAAHRQDEGNDSRRTG